MADKFFGSSEGVTITDGSMSAYVTSEYNSGHMVGDIKGAFLSDTTAETIVGSELVTNGTFDVDTSGWTDNSIGTGSISWNALGYLELHSTDGSNRGKAAQTLTTEVGKTYTIGFTTLDATYCVLRVGTSAGAADLLDSGGLTAAQGFNFKFTATSTTSYLEFWGYAGVGVTKIDNVTVSTYQADRSVNNNGLQVYGTLTKAPVATGADLVAYSGFSADNYLEQPYNSDLDFGTGDFHVMGWVNTGAGPEVRVARLYYDGSVVSGPYILVAAGASGPFITINDGTTSFATPATGGSFANTGWRFLTGSKNGSTLEFYIDGRLVAVRDVSTAGTLNNPNATLKLGRAEGLSALSSNGSKALWRIGAGAPTAEQIKKIYEDEKHLFAEGAQATLYGSSDAVTALAYDSTTDLLHVGTSAGRSDFSGLRRVNNTTDAVTTAISASNSMIVEE